MTAGTQSGSDTLDTQLDLTPVDPVDTAVLDGSRTGTAAAIRRAFREAPALRRGLWITVLLAMSGTALSLVVPILVQQLVDREILGSGSIDGAAVLLRGGLAVAALAMAAVASRGAQLRLAIAAASGLSDLRVKTFGHLHGLSMLHVQAERRGALVARVTSDIGAIQDFMEWGGVQILVGSAQVSLAVVAMLVYRWQLALLVIAGVIVYAGLLTWFQRILGRAHDGVRERAADSLSALSEAISGLPVIRAFGAEPATREKVHGVLERQFRAEFAAGRLGAFLFSSADLFAGMLTAGVIALGLVIGPGSGISAGTLLAFLFLVNLLVDPIQGLVETLDHAQTAGAGLRRVLRVLDTEPDLTDPPQGRTLSGAGLTIRFEEVTFRYPDGAEALTGVSVEIGAGEKVAVVGETGSGKTTFAKLVGRLMDPTSGAIQVGGAPLDEVAFESLRRRVAFVPQEGFLFDASVADNVRYGDPAADAAAVHAAFRELDLAGWLDELPDGIDTTVGERGGRLSSGERQLVALVRAWIADPALLVLDEATSAVDPALEVRLRNAIERLTAGRTSITIAHRLSTAEASDRVLVFDQGRLVEVGTHDELLTRGGTYAALYRDWAAGTASV